MPLCRDAGLLAVPAMAHPLYLFGTIGRAPVLVMLTRDGDALSGWYLYLDRGKEIRLVGHLDADDFHLDETTGSTRTGSFAGTLENRRWRGIWRKPDGGSPLPVALSEDAGAPSSLGGRHACSTRKGPDEANYVYTHRLKLRIAGGQVKALTLFRGETSKHGDDQSCSIALDSLKQVPSDAGILLRSTDEEPGATGGSRCTVRIVGDARHLYVRVGDATEDGDDCRGAGDTMYCSPRSFWTDMVVDRRSGRCKSVE